MRVGLNCSRIGNTILVIMAEQVNAILKRLRTHANPKNVEGMARFGINTKGTLGVSVPILRTMAKDIGKNQKLSLALWKSGVHEARILAALLGEPEKVAPSQMEKWAKDMDSWDVCDAVCGNLFDKTPYAWEKARSWPKREEEFVKRAGYVLMAALAVHDKESDDEDFLDFLPIIVKGATDGRNFVKKGVNWALRQIGKRSPRLQREAIGCAKGILKIDSPSARWIASDAIRELASRTIRQKKERPDIKK
jgi:3-methyladenine DNA glycosylase AlkD